MPSSAVPMCNELWFRIQQVFLNDFLIVEKNLTAEEAAFVIPAQVSL